MEGFAIDGWQIVKMPEKRIVPCDINDTDYQEYLKWSETNQVPVFDND